MGSDDVRPQCGKDVVKGCVGWSGVRCSGVESSWVKLV